MRGKPEGLMRSIATFLAMLCFFSSMHAHAAPADDYNLPEKPSTAPAAATTQSADLGEVMERVATAAQIEQYRKAHPEPMWVFTESRDLPVRRFDALPGIWLERPAKPFHGVARPGEFFVFQIAVYAPTQNLFPLALDGGINGAPKRCINFGGIGPGGKPYTKIIGVSRGEVV